MSAAWMLYAAAVGGLLAAAAALLEQALRAVGLPARGVWVLALLGAGALTLGAPLRREAPLVPGGAAFVTTVDAAPAAAPFGEGPLAATGRALAALEEGSAAAFARGAALLGDAGPAAARALYAGWGAASLVLLLLFGATLLRARRLRRPWPRAEIQGARVRVAPRAGPLVAGVVRPEIVVPRWLLHAPEPEQRLVVAHEREHLGGRDPLLLALGWIAMALVPWSPAGWWMLSRLRLAVELDCDRRVLRAGADRGEYGSVLLDVAARRTATRSWAPAFLEGPTQLEKRIVLMTRRMNRFAALRGIALGALAGVLLLAACEAALPSASEIEAMDVAAAEGAAGRMGAADLSGPDVVHRVDGEVVTAEEARAVAPERIATINVQKRADGGSEVSIRTREAALAAGEAPPVDAAGTRRIVTREYVSETELGQVVEERVVGPVGTVDAAGFEGVLLIDGRRAVPSELRTLSPDAIERVEVVKGAAAATISDDPAARNGIIRITTKGSPD